MPTPTEVTNSTLVRPLTGYPHCLIDLDCNDYLSPVWLNDLFDGVKWNLETGYLAAQAGSTWNNFSGSGFNPQSSTTPSPHPCCGNRAVGTLLSNLNTYSNMFPAVILPGYNKFCLITSEIIRQQVWMDTTQNTTIYNSGAIQYSLFKLNEFAPGVVDTHGFHSSGANQRLITSYANYADYITSGGPANVGPSPFERGGPGFLRYAVIGDIDTTIFNETIKQNFGYVHIALSYRKINATTGSPATYAGRNMSEPILDPESGTPHVYTEGVFDFALYLFKG